MSYPKHPDSIIIKNSFYPSGLKEIDVWDYYQTFKTEILEQVSGRDLFFVILVDLNKPIVVRAGRGTRFVRLTSSNYNTMITGRTISIHSTMKRMEDIAIVDIDSDDFKKAKEACLDCYDFLKTRKTIIDNISIRFTGKESFHILCNLRKKYNIDIIRETFKKVLEESPLSKKYTISHKRSPGIPNLDLAPNKFRGGFITLFSLSEIGLKCMEVEYKNLRSFTQKMASIK